MRVAVDGLEVAYEAMLNEEEFRGGVAPRRRDLYFGVGVADSVAALVRRECEAVGLALPRVVSLEGEVWSEPSESFSDRAAFTARAERSSRLSGWFLTITHGQSSDDRTSTIETAVRRVLRPPEGTGVQPLDLDAVFRTAAEDDDDWEPEPPRRLIDETLICTRCTPAWEVPRRYYGAHVTDHETDNVVVGLVAHAVDELREALVHSRREVDRRALAAASVQEKARAFATAAHQLAVAVVDALESLSA